MEKSDVVLAVPKGNGAREIDIASEMQFIAGGLFAMGSEDHYREEAPVHRVRVDAFWIDRTPVTNRQFREFVDATGYVTFAEIAPKAEDYPGALPHMLKPGSLVFNPPAGPVDLRNWGLWWEFRFGARSWLLALGISAPLGAARLLGLDEPEFYIPLIKLVFSLLSVSLIVSAYRIGRNLISETVGRLSAVLTCFWYELLYFAPRSLIDVVATYFLVFALACATERRERPRTVLFALSAVAGVALRMQYLPLAGLLLLLVGVQEGVVAQRVVDFLGEVQRGQLEKANRLLQPRRERLLLLVLDAQPYRSHRWSSSGGFRFGGSPALRSGFRRRPATRIPKARARATVARPMSP